MAEEQDGVAPSPNGSERHPDGRFGTGNKCASVLDRPRRRLAGVLREIVTDEEFTKSVQNILAISQNPKSHNAAIRAFTALAEVLGIKQLTLELLGDDERPNPAQLRDILLARITELKMIEDARH